MRTRGQIECHDTGRVIGSTGTTDSVFVVCPHGTKLCEWRLERLQRSGFSGPAPQAGRSQSWNRRRRSDLTRYTRMSMHQASIVARQTRMALARAAQMSAWQDRSGRDSTSCCGQTRKRSPYRRATTRVGKSIPTGLLRCSALQLCCHQHRVWRVRVLCHSKACWGDPKRAK